MKSGYLYVLVHPSDPNLYKVGQMLGIEVSPEVLSLTDEVIEYEPISVPDTERTSRDVRFRSVVRARAP